MEHNFVNITVVPIDVRVAITGGVEYTEAPERSADPTPEQVCQICWAPLTPKTVREDCPGPKIPDTPEGLT